ncbi:MAG: hypothetical protein E6J90_04825 [Deltaproteobacteria bacterium]|nr:MAG: hypothetical protein E6J90_04825 [Deltaproteobacteria bacterium]
MNPLAELAYDGQTREFALRGPAMDLINWLNIVVLIAGGILAASGLIVAKKPDAKQLIDKLVPYQAVIGVALLALGLIHLLWWSILLGFLFGMPQIAKWMPGQGGAENKGMELSNKLAPYQGILGLVGLAAALLALLYRLHILSVGF